jgi:hypothetical protein
MPCLEIGSGRGLGEVLNWNNLDQNPPCCHAADTLKHEAPQYNNTAMNERSHFSLRFF